MIKFDQLKHNLVKTLEENKSLSDIKYVTGIFRQADDSNVKISAGFILIFGEEYENKKLFITVNPLNKNYMIYDFNLLQYHIASSVSLTNLLNVPNNPEERLYKQLCENGALLFKVINYEKSSQLFKYTNIKKDMVGHSFKITNILPNYVCKETGNKEHIAEVYNPTIQKSLKFVISDLELFELNIIKLLKGYTLPKIKIIKKGTEVMVINPNRLNLSKTEKYVVTDTRKLSSTTYCQIKANNYIYMIDQKNLKIV